MSDEYENDKGETIVPAKEAAIVTKDAGENLLLCVPHEDSMPIIPDAVIYLTACFIRFKDDPDFVQEQLDWFHERTEDEEGDRIDN